MLTKAINAQEKSDSDRFEAWFLSAKPGDVYIYYIGFLGMENKYKFVKHIKHVAWNYAIKGRVYLFQRKIDEYEFDYIAVKARRYTRKLVPFDYRKSKLSDGDSE